MKRLIIFLVIPFLITPTPAHSSHTATAKSETTTYAKAGANCTLYKSQNMNNNSSNIYFIVPETYFVIVLDEISESCTKVQYDKFIGYVASSSITIATFIPIVKTLENITLDIKETSGTQIWSCPDTNSSILTTISAGAKNINYIASCYGIIPSGGDSNLWYYVTYTPSQNSTNVYEGYIYSENTTNLSEIVANAETNPEIIQDSIDGENILYLSSSFKTAVIIVVTIPIIIFLLIILYKSSKKFKEIANKRKNENEKFKSEENKNEYQTANYSFEKEPENNFNSQPIPLKENLSKMKEMKFVKKQTPFSENNTSYPAFPDYNPDDDIL